MNLLYSNPAVTANGSAERPRHLVVAVNPESRRGGGKAAGAATVAALREAGYAVTEVSESSYAQLRLLTGNALDGRPLDSRPLDSQARVGSATSAGGRDKVDALIVVGGDGMMSMAVNLVGDSGLPVGLIPSGSGNDWARDLGIPWRNRSAAIRNLLAALEMPPRLVDTVRVRRDGADDVWVAGMICAGFDAVVNAEANSMRWPRGASRYRLATLRVLHKLKPISYRLEIDGVAMNTVASVVTISNVGSIGGGIAVSPQARIDDGKIDVFVLAPVSPLNFLRLLSKASNGSHLFDRRVSIYRAERIRIEAEGVIAFADGESLGPLRLDVEVVPHSLRVLAPLP